MDSKLKEHLLSRSLEGIVTTDLAGNIIDCNETALQILGYTGKFLTGEHVSALFPAASASHLLPNLMHLARDAAGFDGEIMLQGADGKQIIVRLFVQAWPENGPREILFRFLDWSETHEIVRQLRESNQMAVLGNLTRSLSHEILNPIAVIGGYTRRFMGSGEKDGNRAEWTQRVMSSVERLEGMIKTLQAYLDLPSPRFTESSPDKILDRSVKNIRTEAEGKGVRIAGEGKGLPDGFLDPRLLETAFTATLVNALERMPDGGVLAVTRKVDEGQGTVLITDTGPSLDLKQIEEDLSPVHVLGGERLHLNLAIARRIVDDHGGQLSLESSRSQGLTVRITLPADRRTIARHRGL
ncbi:MAG: PAS domain S-box protein [bacterium]|nr:PAS domain S-box protein [bacterium]